MAFVAGDFLVLRMTEANAEGLGELRSARVTTQLVARAARGNVASTGLRSRRVTSIASRVSVEACRDRQRNASASRTVTSRAVDAPHLQVQRVIELHSETLQPRERFQRARLHVRMTDGADWTVCI